MTPMQRIERTEGYLTGQDRERWKNDQWELEYYVTSDDSFSRIILSPTKCTTMTSWINIYDDPHHKTIMQRITEDPDTFVQEYREGLVIREEEEMLV